MTQPPDKGKAILVIDDFGDVRAMLRTYLEGHGYRVLEATNGREGIELAARMKPDLILMDLHMPVVNGIEATRQIHRTESLSSVPIVLISAHGEWGIELFSRHQELIQDNVRYISKPIDLDLLTATIDRLLPASQT